MLQTIIPLTHRHFKYTYQDFHDKTIYHLLPIGTHVKRLSHPSEIIHAAILLQLQMHGNVRVYLKRRSEMWTNKKYHSIYHGDGLNAISSNFKAKNVD